MITAVPTPDVTHAASIAIRTAVEICVQRAQAIKYLPARVNQIGKIESRGKVLKLLVPDKVTLTRPFTAQGKNRPVI